MKTYVIFVIALSFTYYVHCHEVVSEEAVISSEVIAQGKAEPSRDIKNSETSGSNSDGKEVFEKYQTNEDEKGQRSTNNHLKQVDHSESNQKKVEKTSENSSIKSESEKAEKIKNVQDSEKNYDENKLQESETNIKVDVKTIQVDENLKIQKEEKQEESSENNEMKHIPEDNNAIDLSTEIENISEGNMQEVEHSERKHSEPIHDKVDLEESDDNVEEFIPIMPTVSTKRKRSKICRALGVCRLPLDFRFEYFGFHLCYRYSTGFVGQCLLPERTRRCQRKRVIACHPIPQIAEAYFNIDFAGQKPNRIGSKSLLGGRWISNVARPVVPWQPLRHHYVPHKNYGHKTSLFHKKPHRYSHSNRKPQRWNSRQFHFRNPTPTFVVDYVRSMLFNDPHGRTFRSFHSSIQKRETKEDDLACDVNETDDELIDAIQLDVIMLPKDDRVLTDAIACFIKNRLDKQLIGEFDASDLEKKWLIKSLTESAKRMMLSDQTNLQALTPTDVNESFQRYQDILNRELDQILPNDDKEIPDVRQSKASLGRLMKLKKKAIITTLLWPLVLKVHIARFFAGRGRFVSEDMHANLNKQTDTKASLDIIVAVTSDEAKLCHVITTANMCYNLDTKKMGKCPQDRSIKTMCSENQISSLIQKDEQPNLVASTASSSWTWLEDSEIHNHCRCLNDNQEILMSLTKYKELSYFFCTLLVPWCLVEKESQCIDAVASDLNPNLKVSHLACKNENESKWRFF